MAALASPDVGVRGRALLRNRLIDSWASSQSCVLKFFPRSDQQILSNLAHVPADDCYTWLTYSTVFASAALPGETQQ